MEAPYRGTFRGNLFTTEHQKVKGKVDGFIELKEKQ